MHLAITSLAHRLPAIILLLYKVYTMIPSVLRPKPRAAAQQNITPDATMALVHELQGQKLVVPNMLKDQLRSWPQGRVNENYERLQHVFNGILDCHVQDVKYRQKLKDSDFALFTSIWWPTAKWEKLYIGGLLTLWAFTWDDTMDMAEQSLSADFERACVHRRQTVAYMRHHLDVEGDELESRSWRPLAVAGRLVRTVAAWMGFHPKPPPCPAGGCDIFKELAERLCQRWDRRQRQRIFRELRDYIMSTEQEQCERLEGVMPTYESYIEHRMYTTAFRNFALIGGICVEAILPDSVLNTAEMEVVLHESNWMITIINDLLSLKKEMATHCMGSLVPLMYHHGERSLDGIVAKLCAELDASIKRLDQAEVSLLQSAARTGNCEKLCKDIKTFVDMIRTTVTGTWEYSCAADRYRIQKYVQDDGSVVIPL